MVRQIPVKEEKDSDVAFFFLFLYTASVLIRPHEMFQISIEWVLIKVFAILALIFVLFAHRPLKLYPQHWMTLSIIPFIAISGFLNSSGTDGIDFSSQFFISSIIPLFLYSTCITSIKKQHALMIICIIAVLLMIHNGHVQQTSYLKIRYFPILSYITPDNLSIFESSFAIYTNCIRLDAQHPTPAIATLISFSILLPIIIVVNFSVAV